MQNGLQFQNGASPEGINSIPADTNSDSSNVSNDPSNDCVVKIECRDHMENEDYNRKAENQESFQSSKDSSLRSLFQNLTFYPGSWNSRVPAATTHKKKHPSDVNDEFNEGQEKSVATCDFEEDEILRALNMGKISLKEDESNSSPNSGQAHIQDDFIRKEDVIQKLANSLREQLDLGEPKSILTEEMYVEMARAMLKCRIKDGMAAAFTKSDSERNDLSNNEDIVGKGKNKVDPENIHFAENTLNNDDDVTNKMANDSPNESNFKQINRINQTSNENIRNKNEQNKRQSEDISDTLPDDVNISAVTSTDEDNKNEIRHSQSPFLANATPISSTSQKHIPPKEDYIKSPSESVDSQFYPSVEMESTNEQEKDKIITKPTLIPNRNPAISTPPPAKYRRAFNGNISPSKSTPSPKEKRRHTPKNNKSAKLSPSISLSHFNDGSMSDLFNLSDDSFLNSSILHSFENRSSKDIDKSCEKSQEVENSNSHSDYDAKTNESVVNNPANMVREKDRVDKGEDVGHVNFPANNATEKTCYDEEEEEDDFVFTSKPKNIATPITSTENDKTEYSEKESVDEFIFTTKLNVSPYDNENDICTPSPTTKSNIASNDPTFLPPKTTTKFGKLRRKASSHLTPQIFKQKVPSDFIQMPNDNISMPTSKSTFDFSLGVTKEALPKFNVDLSNRENTRLRTKAKERKGSLSKKTGLTVNKSTISMDKTHATTAIPNQFVEGTKAKPIFNIGKFKNPQFSDETSLKFQNQSNLFSSKTKELNNKMNTFNNQEHVQITFTHPPANITFNIGSTGSNYLKESTNVPSPRIKKASGVVRRKGSRIARRKHIFSNVQNSKSDQIGSATTAPLFTTVEVTKSNTEKVNVKVPSQNPSSAPVRISPPAENEKNQDYSGLTYLIASLRTEGRDHYTAKNYISSIHSYTTAISNLNSNKCTISKETLAILHGNRAAALMMLGAYSTAAMDSDLALSYVEELDTSSQGEPKQKFLPESGIALRSKLTCRLGRAYLKCGDMKKATEAFDRSIKTSEETIYKAENGLFLFDSNEKAIGIVRQILLDAKCAKNDIKRYYNAIECADISQRSSHNGQPTKKKTFETLKYLNIALTISPGCKMLHERKIILLASSNRWRELAYHCENLACAMVKLDGVFVGNLKGFREDDWVFDIGAAKYLKADHFEGKGRNVSPLSSNAVGEAVARLPRNILPLYLRSLRLEERYAEGHKAGSALESFIASEIAKSANPAFERGKFIWLRTEREKLRRIISCKEKGDTFFRDGLYERSAARYASCLTIDAEGEKINRAENAGGKLHAVLHCNRAACFMALEKYSEAIDECCAALRIESHYMKAILRLARCYARTGKYQNSLDRYQQWMNLVDEAYKCSLEGKTDIDDESCPFDKASDISSHDRQKVYEEFLSVKRVLKDVMDRKKAEAEARAQRERIFKENLRRSTSTGADGRYGYSWEKNSSSSGNRWNNTNSYQGGYDHYRRSTSSGESYSKSKDSYHDQRNRRSKSSGRGERNKYTSGEFGSPGSDISKCHYDVLKVAKNSSTADIKKAYRKVSVRLLGIYFVL